MRAEEQAAPRLLGRVIAGRYRLVALLGEGGMGQVYRATDAEGGAFAVKVLHKELLGSEVTPRFLREAMLTRTIESVHVVPTLDAGHDTQNDALYIVMPLLRGCDLGDLMDRTGPLHPESAVRITLQAAEGLMAAHSLGVVHRDVKPANLFLDTSKTGDVNVRVCDFGVAKLAEGDIAQLTATGTRIGSPLYMSPEQLRSSKHVDVRSDVWSLAVTLYEMLSGNAPAGTLSSVAEIILSVSTRDPREIQDVAPWVEPGLARALHGALARDPAQRTPSMAEFVKELVPFAAGETHLTESMLTPVPDDVRAQVAPRLAPSPEAIATAVSPTDPAPEGDRVLGNVLDGRYRAIKLLGRGGMGAVYEVEALDGRHFAAKVIGRDTARGDRQAMRRFVREARAAGDIDSPHVVRTIEAGADSALTMPFIIMELLDGVDLGTLLKQQGPLEPSAATRVFLQAARGIAAAHDRGIIHRDIKPANLFLQKDAQSGEITVKVCDFGIAKLVAAEGDTQTQELTRTGGVIGSPMYMSPEQARNAKHVDYRTDVWSLCVTFWETLAGRKLWEGQSALGEVILAICSDPIPELAEVAPWVEPALAKIVHRGLVRDPARRWPNIRDMLQELEKVAGNAPLHEKELVPVSDERRQSGSVTRLSLSSSVRGVSGDAATIAVLTSTGSSTIAGHTQDAMLRSRRKRSPIGFVVGGLAIAALGVGGTLFARRPRPEPAPDVTVTADPTPKAEATPKVAPSLETARELALSILPAHATVKVGDTAVEVHDGRVQLNGVPGDSFEVTVSKDGTEKKARVFVTKDGTLEPDHLELEAAAKAVARGGPTHRPSTSKPAQTGGDGQESSSKASAKPAAASPTVKPKDDW